MLKKLFYAILLIFVANLSAMEEVYNYEEYPIEKVPYDPNKGILGFPVGPMVKDERIINAVVSRKPNRLQVIKDLVENKNVPVDARSYITSPNIRDKGNTALMLAASEAADTPGQPGELVPLKYQVIQYLLNKGANINATNYIGYTPLVAAVLSKDPALVKYLIENGADLNIQYGSFNRTLVDLARDDITKQILLQAGVQPSLPIEEQEEEEYEE